MRKLLTAGFAAVLLAGCSTLGATSNAARSDPALKDDLKDGERLVPYTLPRGYLTAKLVAMGSDRTDPTYRLVLLAPDLQPDGRYQLLARARLSAFADESLTIKIDPQTGFLQSIGVVSDDRTDDILPALAATVGAVRAGNVDGPKKDGASPRDLGANDKLLARVVFDPLDESDTAAARTSICTALNSYYGPRACPDADVLFSFSDPAAPGAVRAPLPPTVPLPASDVEKLCAAAMCTPSLRTIRVAVGLPGGGIDEALFQVPDATRLVRIDFRRAAFVKRETSAVFNSGMPVSVSTTKPSEALGVVLLPIRVLRAGLGAFTEVLQLRINVDIIERKFATKQDAVVAVTPYTLPTEGNVAAPAAPTYTQGEYAVPTLAVLAEAYSHPQDATWTAASVLYVSARELVESRRMTFEGACSKRNVEAIYTARAQYRESQAKANSAALVAKVALPFPNLATDTLHCPGTRSTPTAPWDAGKTEYVAKLDVAEGKEAGFIEACTAGAAPAIRVARGQLREGRSAANTAAVLAGIQDLPFPNHASDTLPCPSAGGTP